MPQLLDQEQIKYKERENEMISHDHRSNAKNALAEYIYEMRDKLAGPLEPYVSEADRQAFSMKLNKLEDWLYDEGEDLQKHPYVERLEDLKSTGDIYLKRLREAELRPGAFERLVCSLNRVEKATQNFASGDEAFNHFTNQEMAQVIKYFNETRHWCKKQMSIFQAMKPHENPKIEVFDINRKTESFVQATNSILLKKKPPPHGMDLD
ncbi:hypothetical protein Ciccas_005645 [Cichlidogyrus casuarinus]|uniref:Uncharacterized protein n=1 Tax=Cichlidogyrus casuarinus TaxID=1844966 RepID=A0ABD2Q839_9PLAT